MAVSLHPASIAQLVGQIDAGQEVRGYVSQGLDFSFVLESLHDLNLKHTATQKTTTLNWTNHHCTTVTMASETIITSLCTM